MKVNKALLLTLAGLVLLTLLVGPVAGPTKGIADGCLEAGVRSGRRQVQSGRIQRILAGHQRGLRRVCHPRRALEAHQRPDLLRLQTLLHTGRRGGGAQSVEDGRHSGHGGQFGCRHQPRPPFRRGQSALSDRLVRETGQVRRQQEDVRSFHECHGAPGHHGPGHHRLRQLRLGHQDPGQDLGGGQESQVPHRRGRGQQAHLQRLGYEPGGDALAGRAHGHEDGHHRRFGSHPHGVQHHQEVRGRQVLHPGQLRPGPVHLDFQQGLVQDPAGRFAKDFRADGP